MRKECVICGSAFEARSSANTCSTECLRKKRRALGLARWRRDNPRKTRECVICGAGFAPHGRQKTCGDGCSYVLERRNENARRAANARAIACVVCGAPFRPRGPQKACSGKCAAERDRQYEAARDRSIKAELCRDWRRRNPDKQKAATLRWQENNRERHLESVRRNSAAWRARNPGVKAEQSRRFRELYPEKAKEYQAFRTAAYRLMRLVEQYGADALLPGFTAPDAPTKSEKQTRRSRSGQADRDRQLDAQRRHQAREAAAVKLIRELQSKGLEALL